MRTQLLVASLSLVALAACENPAKGKAKAEVTAAKAETAPAAAGPSTVAYTISPERSKLGFVGSKVTASHIGSFTRFSGAIDVPAGKPEGARVSVTIEMDSVETDAAKLTAHLKGQDFFDVAKFPQATFVTTEIKPGGDKGATHTITGNLELHGVKKSVSFPATVTVGPETVIVAAEFWINRKDFGIAYAGMADDLIRDEVVIKLAIDAPRKK